MRGWGVQARLDGCASRRCDSTTRTLLPPRGAHLGEAVAPVKSRQHRALHPVCYIRLH